MGLVEAATSEQTSMPTLPQDGGQSDQEEQCRDQELIQSHCVG